MSHTISALAIVGVLLVISRFSGGLPGSLHFKSEKRSSHLRPNTGDVLSLRQPVIFELRFAGEQHFRVECRRTTRQLSEKSGIFGDGVTIKRQGLFFEFGDFLAPPEIRDNPDHIIIETGRPNLTGFYWTPIVKTGASTTDFLIRGTGRYKKVRIQGASEVSFSRVGPSTTAHLRRSMELIALQTALNSFTNLFPLSTLETCERIARDDIPPGDAEEAALVKKQKLLARTYHVRGEFEDSLGLYRSAIQQMELSIYSKDSDKVKRGWFLAELRGDLALLYDEVAILAAADPRSIARNADRAIDYATKSCELTEWKDGPRLETLAAAFAERGDFQNATKYQRLAIEHWPIQVEPSKPNAEHARKRLELYENHTPFRLSAKALERLPKKFFVWGDFPLKDKVPE